MAVNPYFNQTTRASEQDLLQDLWDEAIAIHGHEVYYIMREGDNDLDMLFGENPLSHFTRAFQIEMFVKSITQFGGNGEFLSKFGLHIEDQCVFSCSVRRFSQVCGAALVRPREGDYVFIQWTPNASNVGAEDRPHRMVYEIRRVDDKADGLFQLGEHYTWQLTTEQVNYSHERVQTNVEAVDATLQAHAYTITIPLGTGTGAYLVGETVYQGLSFVGASATATVSAYDANTATLSVQNITGKFNDTQPIVGVSSDASYVPAQTPRTTPNDPISDNDSLDGFKDDVVVTHGTNPRFR